MQQLQLLSQKLDLLLRRYKNLQAENQALRATVAEQLQSMEALNEKLAAIEQKAQDISTPKAAISESEKDEFRQRIDTVINEIDRMIKNL